MSAYEIPPRMYDTISPKSLVPRLNSKGSAYSQSSPQTKQMNDAEDMLLILLLPVCYKIRSRFI